MKAMSLNDIDNRGSTPLHWACYSKSEFALSYLLAMNPYLEKQDQAGFTPLHLAIKSVVELKSTRPVRALLLKGASREATNFKGETCNEMISPSLPD
jgi:ankyrin repeat protein